MREVAILGIGQTSVEEHWYQSLRELATQAVVNAMWDAQRDTVAGIFIGNMMSGMVSRQENLGALIADWSGLRGVEAFKVEAACGSGAAAVHLGVMAVASGYMDAVIRKHYPTTTTFLIDRALQADFDFGHSESCPSPVARRSPSKTSSTAKPFSNTLRILKPHLSVFSVFSNLYISAQFCTM